MKNIVPLMIVLFAISAWAVIAHIDDIEQAAADFQAYQSRPLLDDYSMPRKP